MVVVVAAWVCGLEERDLATFCEVGCRRAQVRCGRCWGCIPSRWPLFGLRSSSKELVDVAARQRLCASSSSCSVVRLAGVAFFSVAGFNGRSTCSLVVAREEDEGLRGPVCFSISGVLCVGVRQQCLGSYPLRMFLLVCVHVLFSLMYEYK